MTRVEWDRIGDRRFESGVDRGMFYPRYASGVPWNGLISVDSSPSGASNNPYYMDGNLYYIEATSSDFNGKIEAFTYPDEFEEVNGVAYDGGLGFENQNRKQFGLSYRTLLGNDVMGTDFGYKIHIIFNAVATPTNSPHKTSSAVEDPTNFTWDISAVPEEVEGYKPTAHYTWDTTRTKSFKTEELERILYGSPSSNPRLPTVEELLSINKWGDSLRILPNTKTGLAALSYLGDGDLKGDPERGLYKKHPDSRLVPTSRPGFYKLGE